ncbi:MAG: tRNA uridine-5-carboxymethylaminomethyl(34) synthesis GTPase MnmE [Burkholderiales bacterium]|nr:tRNA uridine-5-carboxymethylaminomethyl(34) synthesis GTPase MnmE [Burkholderiales bacterium]
MDSDNICAIATANGHAGIGIIRISGSEALKIALLLTKKAAFIHKVAQYCDFYSTTNEILDSGLVIYFKAPFSFTGEDVIEIHAHGSPIVLQMLIKQSLELGCRLANPGEFSQRAYINGKIDLIQAESIIDLINAESEATAKSALKSLKGQFSKHIDLINQQLINLRMFVEATLDFPEEDIEFIVEAKIQDKLNALVKEIARLLNNTKQGVLLNNGANIVIIGRPNVGKSSLLNTLANEDIAIVTDIEGTTRDIIKEKIIINGIAFNIIDTAGIRATDDIVEQLGIKRAFSAVETASLCLVIVDAVIGITTDDENILRQIPAHIPCLFVHNKIDLLNPENGQPQYMNFIQKINGQIHIYISAKLKLGITQLRANILDLVGFDNNNTDGYIARIRHLNAITAAVNHIQNGFNNWNNLELLAEELRYDHNKLSEVTGEFSLDDLLGDIFSTFCIWK